ncbi:BadF/BadG/BcrA/BcrD ATPase family protein [Streptomyces sp. NPDC057067]|uniref:BadF/BadG/BcrA/BcrD ATPase family protein n=1 Tax=Streptomyces sp. NPDC057067 TaxID=3346013 RepID=UPI003631DA6B
MLVEVTREQLEFGPDETVPVSYSGGTFGAEAVLEEFATGLKSRFTHYELQHPLYEPVVGAALYAAKIAGTPLDQPALDALRMASGISASEGKDR